MKLPCIILVRPQLPENVGGVARVMYNFGFDELRLISPKLNFCEDEKSIACACGGASVLKLARVFSNVGDGVADLDYLYATTARTRSLNKACTDSTKISTFTDATGIMFGPENSGLSNEDLSSVDEIVYINAKNNPINLMQSVAIICYDVLNKLQNSDTNLTKLLYNYSTKEELNFFYDKLEAELEERGFFQEYNKKVKMMQNIKSIFSRAGLTSQEVRTLNGIVNILKRR